MKEIKYYHLRRNLTDEKPLDFVSLDNAYDFLVGFFTDKQAKLWHCDGIEDSAEPTPEEWVKAVMEEMGQIEVLKSYDYPGNVRELINIRDRASVLDESDFAKLLKEHKEMTAGLKSTSETKEETPDELETAVRIHVKRVYEKYDRNLTKAAEALKAARNTVKKYLED